MKFPRGFTSSARFIICLAFSGPYPEAPSASIPGAKHASSSICASRKVKPVRTLEKQCKISFKKHPTDKFRGMGKLTLSDNEPPVFSHIYV